MKAFNQESIDAAKEKSARFRKMAKGDKKVLHYLHLLDRGGITPVEVNDTLR